MAFGCHNNNGAIAINYLLVQYDSCDAWPSREKELFLMNALARLSSTLIRKTIQKVQCNVVYPHGPSYLGSALEDLFLKALEATHAKKTEKKYENISTHGCRYTPLIRSSLCQPQNGVRLA